MPTPNLLILVRRPRNLPPPLVHDAERREPVALAKLPAPAARDDVGAAPLLLTLGPARGRVVRGVRAELAVAPLRAPVVDGKVPRAARVVVVALAPEVADRPGRGGGHGLDLGALRLHGGRRGQGGAREEGGEDGGDGELHGWL